MDVNIISPTEAIITSYTDKELKDLKKQMSYKNTSIAFLISKHNRNRRWKSTNLIAWQERLDELKNELNACILKNNGKNYYFRPGYISYIKDISINVTNSIAYPELKKLPWTKQPDFDPYPYQAQSVEELLKIKHGSISLPTGCGKSFILLMLAREMGLDAVIVTPSKSIFNELLVEFQEKLGKRYVGGYGDGKKDIKKKITIAIGDSLKRLKPNTEAWDFFQNKKAILVDESHTFAANTLENCCHGVLKDIPYRFFVSATQTRGDGSEKLLHSIIGKTVLDMSLSEAIAKGYLCPLKFHILTCPSHIAARNSDPLEVKRKHFLYNKDIAKMYSRIANVSWKTNQESTLILVEELRQIKMLVDLLEVPYAYVHSQSKKEAAEWGLEKVKLQDEVDKFNNGEARVLIGTRAISTGTNMYPTHNTCNWLGGSSEIYTKQGPMGRSTRRLEISKFKDFHKPKPFTRVFDIRVDIDVQVDCDGKENKKDKAVQSVLNSQLERRCKYYEESGEKVKHF